MKDLSIKGNRDYLPNGYLLNNKIKFKQSCECKFINNNEDENINNLLDHGLISDKYYLQYIIKKYGIKI